MNRMLEFYSKEIKPKVFKRLTEWIPKFIEYVFCIAYSLD